MSKFDEKLYLVEMYADSYYPDVLVDKIKDSLIKVVLFLESGNQDIKLVQEKFDQAMTEINDLQEAFWENDSDIETVARDSIGQTVSDILTHFHIDLDVEEAMRERDW